MGTTSILTERSGADYTPEPTPVQSGAAGTPLEPLGQECCGLLAAQPPANVREWEAAQPVSPSGQHIAEPIHSAD